MSEATDAEAEVRVTETAEAVAETRLTVRVESNGGPAHLALAPPPATMCENGHSKYGHGNGNGVTKPVNGIRKDESYYYSTSPLLNTRRNILMVNITPNCKSMIKTSPAEPPGGGLRPRLVAGAGGGGRQAGARPQAEVRVCAGARRQVQADRRALQVSILASVGEEYALHEKMRTLLNLRYLFPVIFAVFNVAYWTTYLIQANQEFEILSRIGKD